MTDDKFTAKARELVPECDRCMIPDEPANYRCDLCDERIADVEAALQAAADEARKDEREACAACIEEVVLDWMCGDESAQRVGRVLQFAVDAIRARGAK